MEAIGTSRTRASYSQINIPVITYGPLTSKISLGKLFYFTVGSCPKRCIVKTLSGIIIYRIQVVHTAFYHPFLLVQAI
jgi:hypothetical protein